MTPMHDPPEIEPLSDTSWKRIERDLFSRLDRTPAPAPEPRWRWKPVARWTAGLATAALAAAAVLLLIAGSDDDPSSPHVQPRVVTGDAPTELTVGRATLDIASHSSLWVNASQKTTTIMLEQGTVTCTVPSRPADQPFIVTAGDVRVEVIGTQFSVSHHGESIGVAVTEGVVQVFHDGRLTSVKAGESWQSGSAQRAGTAPQKTETAGDAVSETASHESEKEAHRPGPKHSERRKAKRQRTPALSLKDRYETAARLEASDPEAAIAIYRELSHERGSWAANALYARARLEAERDNLRTASRLLRRYLRRYPRGANAPDARTLLDKLE